MSRFEYGTYNELRAVCNGETKSGNQVSTSTNVSATLSGLTCGVNISLQSKSRKFSWE